MAYPSLVSLNNLMILCYFLHHYTIILSSGAEKDIKYVFYAFSKNSKTFSFFNLPLVYSSSEAMSILDLTASQSG